MAIDKVSAFLDTLALSYREMNEFGFNAQFTQDYLEQIRNILLISGKTDEVIDRVNENTDRLDILEPIVADNVFRLDTLEPIVANNVLRLDVIEPIVANNTNRLDIIEPIVADNTIRIGDLETGVSDNSDRLDIIEPIVTDNAAAIALANGQLVGNMDYATASVGGVVDLAALVSDLTQIVTPDIGAAPAAYDQTYTQSVTDLTNENKAKINEIVTKVNEIIAGQISAKQMSNV